MPPSNLLLASKIVVLEEPPSIRNIPGVATAVAAFAGVFERGPVRVPQFVTSFEEAVDVFGTFTASTDALLALQGFFQNGGTAAWISRVQHYTDVNNNATGTAAKGSLTLKDRGGVAGPAVATSVDGPFDLEPSEVLQVNVNGGGNQNATFTATGATITGTTGNKDLSGGTKTIVYQIKLPGSSALSEQQTFTFVDADFAVPTAATPTEVVLALAARGYGFNALLSAGAPRIVSNKRGSGAQIVLVSGTALAVLGGGFAVGTTNGTGNVADVDAVTATEVKAVLDAIPLLNSTVTVSGAKVVITSTATGAAVTIVIGAGTTAVGIFSGALPITYTGSAAAESDTIRVDGKDPGNHVAGYTVVIEAPTSSASDEFNFRLKKGTVTLEVFTNLSMTTTSAKYCVTVVNANSGFIQLVDLNSPAASPNDRPKEGSFTSWTGGNDGLVGLVDVDFTGSDAGDTGLFAFDTAEITLLAVPGRSTSAVHNAMVTYCEVQRVGLVFAVLDPPAGQTAQGMVTYIKTTAALSELSEFAAIYWPRVKILNPSTAVFGLAEQIVVAPSGHVLGMFARIDASRAGGVFQPPAGIENGRLFGVVGLETTEVNDERKRDVVFPERINPITQLDGGPFHVDGARTLKSSGSFPTVAERRGVIFVEASLKKGLLFAKHQNNDRRLRMSVKRAIEAFLLIQFQNGAFRGATAGQSFFVDVSDALNPEEVIFAGQLRAKIGLATQKPAEFVILTFTQDTRALEESIAAQVA